MPINRLQSFAALASFAVCSLAFSPLAAAGETSAEWQRDPSVAGLMAPLARVLEVADEQAARFSPRAVLTALANGLRDIRYRRGGREPATGFDCSGFVRYVFQHSLNVELPASSAAQFLTGLKIDRKQLEEGDLVFFRTEGKRISHVGIYLGDGRFIHAPSSGKRVSVSSLAEAYWSKRYAGAKRPDVLAQVDDNSVLLVDERG
jgi:hypothetical protein